MRNHNCSPSRTARIALGMLLCAVLFINGTTLGQTVNRDRVQEAIEQTDRLIEEARAGIDQASDVRAGLLLKQAEQFQERAKRAFDDGRLALALQMTERARDAARRCIGSIVDAGDTRSFVEQQLDITDEWLEQVRALGDNSTSPTLALRMQEAGRLQDRARDLLSENSLRQSLLLTRRAQEICRDLIARLNTGERRKENLRLNLDRAQTLIDDNKESVEQSGNAMAQQLFNSGVEFVGKSEESYQAGRFEESLRYLATGLAHVNKALRLIKSGSATDEALRAIEIADVQLERLIQAAADQNTHAADAILDEARAKLERARNFYESGNRQEALVVVRVVMELNQQAAKILGTW